MDDTVALLSEPATDIHGVVVAEAQLVPETRVETVVLARKAPVEPPTVKKKKKKKSAVKDEIDLIFG